MASSIGILPGRIKCWHANCRTSVDGCASFLVFANGIVRTTALTPSEPCSACDHAWYSHQLTSEDMTHQNSPHRRGGLIDSGCGGFYAPVEPGDWTFQTVCACGRALRSHEILNSLATVPTSTVIPTPISSDASGIPMTHGVSLFSNAFPVLGRQDSCSPNPPLVSAPPIEAYRGVRAAEPGRTIDRRNASAERARLALSSSLQNVARIRRQTQIPHSHPTAHISLLSANQSGPSSSAATSSQPDPSDASARRFCVLFVPHVVRCSSLTSMM
ncbi:hypothetical protein C8Q73DRAFT_331137 [Cubamyces lactineus]|nr:hypothetical protein C8Q73DRAFT_331137 [Cubamyces lactineus]